MLLEKIKQGTLINNGNGENILKLYTWEAESRSVDKKQPGRCNTWEEVVGQWNCQCKGPEVGKSLSRV